jgi:hypothetical protein
VCERVRVSVYLSVKCSPLLSEILHLNEQNGQHQFSVRAAVIKALKSCEQMSFDLELQAQNGKFGAASSKWKGSTRLHLLFEFFITGHFCALNKVVHLEIVF